MSRELDVLLKMSGDWERLSKTQRELNDAVLKSKRMQVDALRDLTREAEKTAAAREKASKKVEAAMMREAKLTQQAIDRHKQMSGISLRLVGNLLLLAQAYHTITSILQPFVRFLAESNKRAIDNAESLNLITVVFKDQIPLLREWSAAATSALVNPRIEVERQAAIFYQMANNMGLSRDAAFDLSTSLTDLVADMASFRNVAPEEMFVKISAALAGEYEPLKRIGIVLTENMVKQEALIETGKKHEKQLMMSEKVMARYNLIMRQTTEDQGDLERTSTSMANVLRALEARYKDAQDLVGQFAGGNKALATVLHGVERGIAAVLTQTDDWIGKNDVLMRSVQATIAGSLGTLVLVLNDISYAYANAATSAMAFIQAASMSPSSLFTKEGQTQFKGIGQNMLSGFDLNKRNHDAMAASVIRAKGEAALGSLFGFPGASTGNPPRGNTDFPAYGGGGGRQKKEKDAWVEANRNQGISGWNAGSGTPLGNFVGGITGSIAARVRGIVNPRAAINFSRIGFGSLDSGDTVTANLGAMLAARGAAPRTMADNGLAGIIDKIGGGNWFDRFSDAAKVRVWEQQQRLGSLDHVKVKNKWKWQAGVAGLGSDEGISSLLGGYMNGGLGGAGAAAGGIVGSAFGGPWGMLGGLLGGGIGRTLKGLFGGKKRRGETPAMPLYTHDVQMADTLLQLLNVTKSNLNRSAAGGTAAQLAQLNAQYARAGIRTTR